MEIVRIIREHLGLIPSHMSRALEKNSLPAYLKLERHNTKITLVDLIRLQTLSGLTPADFWELLVESAKIKPRRK